MIRRATGGARKSDQAGGKKGDYGIELGKMKRDEFRNKEMVTGCITNGESKFISFATDFASFRHIVELTDCRRYNNLALKRDDAICNISNKKGNVHESILKDARFFYQNIFFFSSCN